MFRTRSRDPKANTTAQAPRRAFRPDGDRLESREVLNATSLFGNSTMTFPFMTGTTAVTPAFAATTFGASRLGGTSVVSTPAVTNLASTFNNFGLGSQNFINGLGTATRIASSFINLPNNINPNLLVNGGRFITGTLSQGSLNPGLTSGFGVQSGLAFNQGLGGTGFGLGSNVGFNGNLFGNGLGASTGLAFNNGLGGFGNGSFLSSSGLAFNQGLGGFGLGSRNGLGTAPA